jgi:hypothetical protein
MKYIKSKQKGEKIERKSIVLNVNLEDVDVSLSEDCLSLSSSSSSSCSIPLEGLQSMPGKPKFIFQ